MAGPAVQYSHGSRPAITKTPSGVALPSERCRDPAQALVWIWPALLSMYCRLCKLKTRISPLRGTLLCPLNQDGHAELRNRKCRSAYSPNHPVTTLPGVPDRVGPRCHREPSRPCQEPPRTDATVQSQWVRQPPRKGSRKLQAVARLWHRDHPPCRPQAPPAKPHAATDRGRCGWLFTGHPARAMTAQR